MSVVQIISAITLGLAALVLSLIAGHTGWSANGQRRGFGPWAGAARHPVKMIVNEYCLGGKQFVLSWISE
jgi:hypothetical protein